MTETNVQPDEGTIYFEITRSRTATGYLYAVFVDHQGEPTLLASGHEDSLSGLFLTIQNVTERTL